MHAGHVNDCVRLAVAAGVSVEDALVLATSNPADYHHFDHLGWLAPGYQADVLCFDDLVELRAGPGLAGRPARGHERLVVPGAVPHAPAPEWMRASVHLEHPPAPMPSTASRPPVAVPVSSASSRAH